MRDACGWEYCAAWLASMAVWLWLNRNVEWAGLRRLQRVLVRFGLRSADDSGGPMEMELVMMNPRHGRQSGTMGKTGMHRHGCRPSALPHAWPRCGRPYAAEPPWSKRSKELQGAPFAVPELTRFRIDMAVRSRCSLQEQHKHVDQLGANFMRPAR